jgi:predicted DNA-binding ribbon-helix-helix protein
VAEVDKGRNGNLSSALRVFVLATLQAGVAAAPGNQAPQSGSPPDVV